MTDDAEVSVRISAHEGEAVAGIQHVKQEIETLPAAISRVNDAGKGLTQVLGQTGAAAARNGVEFRMLGYQLQDVFQGIALGQNPMIILAQQGGQVAMSLENAGGKLGVFASFLSGPVGASIMGVTMIVGMLTQAWLANRVAVDAEEMSLRALHEAYDLLKEKSSTLLENSDEEVKKSEKKAEAALREARAKLALVESEILLQTALQEGIQNDPQLAGLRIANAERLNKLNEKALDLANRIGTAERAVNLAGAIKGSEKIEDAFDKMAAAKRRWDAAQADLANARALGHITQEIYEQRLQAARKTFEEEQKLAQAEKRKPHEENRSSVWEVQLAAKRNAYEAEKKIDGSYREWSKAQDAAYWAAILKRHDLSKNERIAIEGKYQAAVKAAHDKELAEEKHLEDQKKALAEETADHAIKMESLKGQAATQTARDAYAQGLISRKQLLQMEMAFEAQMHAIHLKALKDRLTTIDPTRDPVAYQKVLNQIETAEVRHRLKMKALDQQEAREKKTLLGNLVESQQQVWSQGLAQMMKGQISFSDGIKGTWNSIANTAIDNISRMIVQWLVGLATKKAINAKEIMSDAYAAAAGAYKAVASIPIVGPILAPVAAGVAFAGTAAFASAAGGYDIPAGINPLTQLHEKEMVLPAKHADVIRGLADNGGAATTAPVHVNMKSMRVGDFFMMHRAELAKVMKVMNREFMFK